MKKCPYCGAEIVYTNVRGIGVRAPIPCQCFGATAERARLDEEDELRSRMAVFKTAVERADIPPTLKLYDSWGDDGVYGYYLYGEQGRGKSEMASGIVRRYLSDGIRRLGKNAYHEFRSAKFINVPDWLAIMRSTYGKRGSSDEEVMQRYSGVGLLVLDDIGKGKMTEWAIDMIYRVIDNRYRNGRPTTYTTQYDLQRLAGMFASGTDAETASAIASRIGGTCVQVRVDGPDWRTRKR